MDILKSMLITKQAKEENKQLSNNQGQVETENMSDKETFQQWGFTQAGFVEGKADALKTCLEKAHINIQRKIAKNQNIQIEHRIQTQNKINALEAECRNIDNKIKTEQESLTIEEGKIDEAKEQIEDIKKNGVNGIPHPSKLGLFIGVSIIIGLTLYLFIFYSSASYSGLFKDSNSIVNAQDFNAATAIFDATAIPDAFERGLGAGFLILLLPFVFLGLGYLIHSFSKENGFSKYFKIGVLICITFIFDFILAFRIEKIMYDIETINNPGLINRVYTMSIAVQESGFWLIIFAGFIVYLIWGLVFDFVMSEWDKQDVVKNQLDKLYKEIKRFKGNCNTLKSNIRQLIENKNIKLGEIQSCKDNLANPFIPLNNVIEAINEYYIGWRNYLTGRGVNANELNNCANIKDNYIKNIPTI